MINKKLEEEKYINMLTESSNEEIQSQSDQNKSSEREESSSVRSKSLSLNLLQSKADPLRVKEFDKDDLVSVDKVLNFFKNNAETKHVKNYFTVFKNLIIKKWEEHQSLNNPIDYASTMEVPQSTKESMWRSIRIFSQLFPDDHKMNKMDNGARVASPIKRFRPRIVFPEFNCMGKTKFINAFGKCDPDFFFLMIFVCYSSVELEQIFSLTYKNIKIASQENYSEDEQKETVTIKYRSRYRGARNVQSSKLSIDPNFEYPINIQAKNEDENIVPSSFSFKGWLSKRSDINYLFHNEEWLEKKKEWEEINDPEVAEQQEKCFVKNLVKRASKCCKAMTKEHLDIPKGIALSDLRKAFKLSKYCNRNVSILKNTGCCSLEKLISSLGIHQQRDIHISVEDEASSEERSNESQQKEKNQ